MTPIKFTCEKHPKSNAISLCTYSSCQIPLQCDLCTIHHKLQNPSHSSHCFPLKLLLFPELIQNTAEYIPSEVLTMINEITLKISKISEQFQTATDNLILSLKNFILHTFSISTINQIQNSAIKSSQNFSQTNSLNEFQNFANGFQKMSSEIKSINIDSYRIKFTKLNIFFAKIQSEFSDYFINKTKEIDLEATKVNSQISLNNMMLFQSSTVLKDIPSREFVSLQILSPKQHLELIYRASRDGVTPQDFHTHCDLKGPTLLLAKSGTFVFGGYTEASWTFEQVGLQKSCPNSFLFSFNNLTKYTLKKDHISNAIYCRYNCGPVFGKGGYDLFICAGSLTANGSTPCSFGNENEGFSHFSLGGSRDFDLDDYEVYRVKSYES